MNTSRKIEMSVKDASELVESALSQRGISWTYEFGGLRPSIFYYFTDSGEDLWYANEELNDAVSFLDAKSMIVWDNKGRMTGLYEND